MKKEQARSRRDRRLLILDLFNCALLIVVGRGDPGFVAWFAPLVLGVRACQLKDAWDRYRMSEWEYVGAAREVNRLRAWIRGQSLEQQYLEHRKEAAQ